jgi:DNA-binding NarL/FixJ family response regulator
MPNQMLQDRRIVYAEDDRGRWSYVTEHLALVGVTVECCSNALELRRMLEEQLNRFDAVVLDLYDMGTSEAKFIPSRDLPLLIQRYTHLPFIIYSSDDHLAQQYESIGARGYVLKDDTVRSLISALKAVVIDGKQMYYSGSVELRVRLTRREIEVLQLSANGLTAQEIATALCIVPVTVDAYRQRIFEKLCPDDEDGSRMNIARAVAIALREGVIR